MSWRDRQVVRTQNRSSGQIHDRIHRTISVGRSARFILRKLVWRRAHHATITNFDLVNRNLFGTGRKPALAERKYGAYDRPTRGPCCIISEHP